MTTFENKFEQAINSLVAEGAPLDLCEGIELMMLGFEGDLQRFEQSVICSFTERYEI